VGEYKNILVAYDGSDVSNNALEQAVGFAREKGSNVVAVTVTTQYESMLEMSGTNYGDNEFLETGAEALAFSSSEEEGYTLIRSAKMEGSTHEAIIDVARARGSDLIVMGRSGLTGLERLLMGSVTARVIGHSPIDVLVMPPASVIEVENILIATDGSSYSELAAKRALNVAHSYGAKLNVVTVIDVPAEFYANDPILAEKLRTKARGLVEPIGQKAQETGVDVDLFIKEGITHEEIVILASNIGASFIIVGSHGKTGIDRLLMGSVTERIIGNSSKPVLVVKSPMETSH